jgi:TatD DNase family protein
MVDTHCHLGLCEPPDAELVAEATRVGVRRMLTVGIDEAASEQAIAAAEAHEAVHAAVGRHPNGTTGFDDAAAARIEELAGHPRVAAVGETGLDFYRDRAPRADQRHAFVAHVRIARRVAKPLVIHVRDGGATTDGEALAETFEILRAEATGVTVILHCFSAPAIRAGEAADWGWYCSFAGNLTYPKSEPLREAAAEVPDELLLVETDAPFLAPQPVRGRRNEPANVVATAEALAELRGVTYPELEATVEANAARVFGW